jgi:hypothetical protein
MLMKRGWFLNSVVSVLYFVENWIDKLDVTNEDLNELLESNPSLRGMIMGYLAEIKLKDKWFNDDRITSIYKPDDHNRNIKADWVIEYNGYEYTIEVKSIQSNSIKTVEDSNKHFLKGKFQCDASDSRFIELENSENIKTTCLKKGQFDILAINLYPFTGNWDFAFAKNNDLPTTNYSKYDSNVQNQLLKGTMNISYPFCEPYYSNPYNLLDNIEQ